MAGAHRLEERHREDLAHRARQADAHVPDHGPVGAAHAVGDRREALEDVAGVHEEPRAGLRRHGPARAAMQQGEAKLTLHVADVLAQRGLGDAQRLSGLRERALLDDRDEVAELAQVHGAGGCEGEGGCAG